MLLQIDEGAAGTSNTSPYKQAVKVQEWLNAQCRGERKSNLAHFVVYREATKDTPALIDELFVLKDERRAVNEDRMSKWVGDNTLLLSPSAAKAKSLLPRSQTRFLFDWSLLDVASFSQGTEIGDQTAQSARWEDCSEVITLKTTAMRLIATMQEVPNILLGSYLLTPTSGTGKFSFQKGIEVGQTFYLGTKYSEAMKATIQDYSNESIPLEMVRNTL